MPHTFFSFPRNHGLLYTLFKKGERKRKAWLHIFYLQGTHRATSSFYRRTMLLSPKMRHGNSKRPCPPEKTGAESTLFFTTDPCGKDPDASLAGQQGKLSSRNLCYSISEQGSPNPTVKVQSIRHTSARKTKYPGTAPSHGILRCFSISDFYFYVSHVPGKGRGGKWKLGINQLTPNGGSIRGAGRPGVSCEPPRARRSIGRKERLQAPVIGLRGSGRLGPLELRFSMERNPLFQAGPGTEPGPVSVFDAECTDREWGAHGDHLPWSFLTPTKVWREIQAAICPLQLRGSLLFRGQGGPRQAKAPALLSVYTGRGHGAGTWAQ